MGKKGLNLVYFSLQNLLLLCRLTEKDSHNKHEKTRFNRADALFIEFICNDYTLISQFKSQTA